MKKVTRSIFVMCLFSMLVLGCATTKTDSDSTKGVRTGKLVITAVPGTSHNLIVKSSVDIEAVFTNNIGEEEYYIGEMGLKLGVDLSVKKGEKVIYAVFSPASDYETGSYALQGKYFGTKVDAELGVGVGAQILLGGFDGSFSLQPLALAATKGYGASAGIGYLYLQKDQRK